MSVYRCPLCRGALARDNGRARCVACSNDFSLDPFPTFLLEGSSGGETDTDTLPPWIHENEEQGAAFKVANFYLPQLARLGPVSRLRVLDDGCGAARVVEELAAVGVDAYGVDPGVRWSHWQARRFATHLCRADGLGLPFADGFFDAVLSNGVLEHVGEFRPDRVDLRARYIAEAMRVLRPGGVLLLAHPNGACPLDFWHGGRRSIRPHRPYESWMPNVTEVRRYLRKAAPDAAVEVLSPSGYVSFLRVRKDPVGRALMPIAQAVVATVDRIPQLRGSPLNPALVVRATKA